MIRPSYAVNLLGFDTVKNLVLGVGAFSKIKVSSKIFSIKQLWSYSMVVGTQAKKIALNESEDKELIDNCFIAGILHDIGKLVFLTKMLDEYEQAIRLAEEKGIRLRSAEKEIFGIVHGDIGVYLMGLWGMLGPVVEAIGFHHRKDEYPRSGFSPAVAVYGANVFYYENRPGNIIGSPNEMATDHLQTLGMSEEINHWREICSGIFEQDYRNE